ncbi:MAG: diphosphate--fructose-6-phosphate 1-phosphotransferase [Spirochaetes bacterium]|nr:diphosphate--fructose-6-phosphate 1-phosphotransferase [Spirochaetota bacterium]
MDISPLQKARYSYQPKLPAVLRGNVDSIGIELGKPTEAVDDRAELRNIFKLSYGAPIATFVAKPNRGNRRPLVVGVILSGGQAPGGHNVIAGLFDGLKKGNPGSRLVGFSGGPSGLVDDLNVEITAELVEGYRNTGGFDIIGSGRTKIETPEQFEKALRTAKRHGLDAVVVIGGDDSNTNAALLAEFFKSRGEAISVIGAPKTIDGDLKNEYIEASFGFDTATKTYAELVGNIERDANSARKYWHFVKLMGRSASHITLEVALQTRPNVALVSEEIEAKGMTLTQVVDAVCDPIVRRADRGFNFGVVLVPEGLVEFVPEFKTLIAELNDLLAREAAAYAALSDDGARTAFVSGRLAPAARAVYDSLPGDIRRQLIMDRDPHGNVQVSRIETEKLLISMVENRLAAMKAAGTYRGTWSAQNHFFGYEGRCAFPSNFDADYCYSLGFAAFVLIANGLSGYLSSVRNLTAPAAEWVAGGIPLTMMMNLEKRHGEEKPVIRKALVGLDAAPFGVFAAARDEWAVETCYRYPGAIQYFGPDEVCNAVTETLRLESLKK